jgi:cyclic beta-1,2-glucan synthetase
LLPRLADNERVLLAAYDVVTAAATPGQRIVPAEAWLLDNFYLIEQQIGLARRHLPRGYSRQLPRLAEGPLAGFPRIYDLALELISHMDGRVDSDNATQFIAAYQTVEPLKLGELWAFPIMLQLALLENLRRVGVRIAQRREERDAAITWADRMLAAAETDPKQLIHLLAAFAHADVPLTAPFVEEFYDRLQAQGPAMAFVQTWVEQKLLEQGVTAAELSEVAGRTAAANQISIANSIGSLRFIGAMDWKQFVESLSVVEQTLREDPLDATRTRISPPATATATSSRTWRAAAPQRTGGGARSHHAGAGCGRATRTQCTQRACRLLPDRHGRPQLERAVGCRLPWKSRIAARAGICACSSTSARSRCSPPWWSLAVVLVRTRRIRLRRRVAAGAAAADRRLGAGRFAGEPAGHAGDAAARAAAPGFFHGIPDRHRTMVIVPTLLTRPEDVDTLLEAMEIRYLGNRDPNLFFALLTDFADAPEQTLPGDAALLEPCARRSRGAQRNLPRRPPLHLLPVPPAAAVESLRARMDGLRAQARQAGAVQCPAARRCALAFSDIVGDPSLLESIQYVITLDTDTQLPRDAAHTLVGNLAHPLNRPVYDAAKGRIVEGYAILQPRASISLTSAGQSRFTRLFAGDSGLDPYTREVSDVYQDVFGEGSFVGKGIYDVDAFRQAVDGRFPENLILSHDLLESGYARSALVTDVELIEEHPASVPARPAAATAGYAATGSWPAGCCRGCRARPMGEDEAAGQPAVGTVAVEAVRQPAPQPGGACAADPAGRRLAAGPGARLVVDPAGRDGGVSALGAVHPDRTGAQAGRTRLAGAPEPDRQIRRPAADARAAEPGLPALRRAICLGAILRSGVRMLFTRRGLLLWQLPAYARRNARQSLADFFREMWIAPVLAVALGADAGPVGNSLARRRARAAAVAGVSPIAAGGSAARWPLPSRA